MYELTPEDRALVDNILYLGYIHKNQFLLLFLPIDPFLKDRI